MPEIQVGSTDILDIQVGSVDLNEVRTSATTRWLRAGAGAIRDDADRPDAATPGANWTDHGPSTDYMIGITNGRFRVQIPDSAPALGVPLQTSHMRYNPSTLAIDDGYVECRVATRGDSTSLAALSGYYSMVFGRGSNAAATHGVGIGLKAGHVWIVSRASSVNGFRADCGTFQQGDILRMTFIDYIFTMFKNGRAVEQWNDSLHHSSKGAGFRSLLMRQDGAKDLLGPRRFSPALDYVQMGPLP